MSDSIKNKVRAITARFGMNTAVIGQAMNVTAATVRKKDSDKEKRHSFNEENLANLIDYIKTEAKKI